MGPDWFLDCYNYGAMNGREFPVNTFYSMSLEKCLAKAGQLLRQGDIHEVRVSHQTKGQAPICIDERPNDSQSDWSNSIDHDKDNSCFGG